MSKPLRIHLGPDDILALSTLERMPDEESEKIEHLAEEFALKTGMPVVDSIVMLMKIGQMFNTTEQRVFRHDKETG